jgi:hypothetical protein
VDVRFGSHSGLKSDIAQGSEKCQNRTHALRHEKAVRLLRRHGRAMAAMTRLASVDQFLPKALERFQAKWTPVRVKKTRQIKNLEPRFDSIEAEKALAVLDASGTADGFNNLGGRNIMDKIS